MCGDRYQVWKFALHGQTMVKCGQDTAHTVYHLAPSMNQS